MRANCLKSSALALLLGALVSHVTTASAQLYNIFPVTQTWRYDINCHDGDGWQAPGYVDTAWTPGSGGFTGGETAAGIVPILTTTSIPAPNSFGGHAVYFRTHFTVPSAANVQLVISNAIDDGAAIYLNGTAVASHRVTAGATCASFSSGGAIGANTDALLWEVDTLSPAQLSGILIDGDNVLAVEVHQANGTSSDMVFAMVLMGLNNPPPPPPPISFTNMAGPITFDTAPPVQQWSTRAVAGAGTDVTTVAGVDTAVQALDASTVTFALPAVGGNPPVAGGMAQYASDAGAQYVMTRPTGTLGDVIMATLTNNSGGSLSGLNFEYTLTVNAPVAEEVPGQVVYYSLSGAPNSWVQIPGVSSQPTDTTAGTYNKSAILSFATPWAANTKMYFLWADDNGSGTPDTACEIDNVKWSLPMPPHITSCTNLTNQTVLQCRSSDTMSVVAEGGNYQWVHNGVDITGANGPSFTIVNMQAGDAGTYTVRVFNGLGSTSCPPVTVSYEADTLPPTIIYAVGSTDLVTIVLGLSEAINTNNLSEAVFSFTLLDLDDGSALYSITGAAVTNGDTTLLLTNDPPRNPDHHYKLSLDSSDFLQDACAGNAVAQGSMYVLNTFYANLLAIDGIWRYEDTDTDLGTAWIPPGYNDSLWKVGAGVFDAKRDANGTAGLNCRPTSQGLTINTCLAFSNTVTHTEIISEYFRTTFTYTGNPINTVLQVHIYRDDGVVLYLNGQELTRQHMPTGPITHTTLANTPAVGDVGDASSQDIVFIASPAALVTGQNYIAAEVHQESAGSSDISFALVLDAIAQVAIATPPHLTITLSGPNVIITWTGGGTLIFSDDITVPRASWTTIPGATSGYSVAATAAHRFYSVRVP